MKNILSFDEIFDLLVAFSKKYGHCNIPVNYVTEDGVKLGNIVKSFRDGNRRVSEEERKRLNDLGFVWNNRTSFSDVLSLLIEYKKEHGDYNVPQKYVTKNGIKLGYIVRNIRYGCRKVSVEDRLLLDLIGFK